VIEPIIIPTQQAKVGDIIEYDGQSLKVDEYFSRGGDMKSRGYSHIMFDNKGAFGLVAE